MDYEDASNLMPWRRKEIFYYTEDGEKIQPSYMLSGITLVSSRSDTKSIKMSWKSRCMWRGADHSLRWLHATLTKSATCTGIIFIETMREMMTTYYYIEWNDLRTRSAKKGENGVPFVNFISFKLFFLFQILEGRCLKFYFGGGECRAVPNESRGIIINNSRDAQA